MSLHLCVVPKEIITVGFGISKTSQNGNKLQLAALEQSTAQLRQQAQELEKTLCELQSAQTQL